MAQRFKPYDSVTDDEYDAIDELHGLCEPEQDPEVVEHGFTPCHVCGTSGMAPITTTAKQSLYGKTNNRRRSGEDLFCHECRGVGHVNVPLGPTIWEPGTEGKQIVLSARLFGGLPLYHDDDATYGTGLRDKNMRCPR